LVQIGDVRDLLTFLSAADTRFVSSPSPHRRARGHRTIITQHDYTYGGLGNRFTHRETIGTTTTSYGYSKMF